MKTARMISLFASAIVCSAPAALAEPAADCEHGKLMRSLSRLHLGQAARVAKTDSVALELVEGRQRQTAIEVRCDAIEVPIAQEVEVPTDKRPANTRVVAGVTVSRTAAGAISLDFPAGVVDLEPVQVLVMFDDSVSVVRGDRVLYAFARHADGTTVETEGIGNGCGCERTTRPDGEVSVRRLKR